MPVSRTVRRLLSVAALSCISLSSAIAGAETLSADAAVRRAASQNPELRAALLDVKAARQAVASEEAARVPTFVADASGEYSESIGPTDRTDSESLRSSAAFRFLTSIGTSIETGVQTSVTWRDLTGTGSGDAGPTYGASAFLTARQPLLRGAGKDVGLASLNQARASKTSAEREQAQAASKTTLDVLGAYWELWYADRAVGVQERSLEVAKKQLADATTKASPELGTGSKVDVLQFASSVASIQDALSQARTSRASRAIELGRLLAMTPDDALGLDTTSEIPTVGEAPSAEALKKAVLGRSNELASMRSQIESQEIKVLAARDADQPKLDVFGTVTAGGVWTSGDAYGGLSVPGGRPAFGVMAGIELEVPMGESRAKSEAARAQTQLEATRERYQARVDGLTAQVGTLEVELEAAKTQVDLASQTSEIAGQLADAERARMALGTTTSVNVVRAEQTLREAELRQLRAVVNRATKQFTLEHSAGALLDRFGSVFAGGRSS